jgi:hypothetical protein
MSRIELEVTVPYCTRVSLVFPEKKLKTVRGPPRRPGIEPKALRIVGAEVTVLFAPGILSFYNPEIKNDHRYF